MKEHGAVRKLLEQTGETAFLLTEGGGDAPFLASLQPVLGLGAREDGPLGAGRRRKARLYALWEGAAKQLAPEDRIRWGGVRYRILQAEVVRFGGRPLYLWATAEPEEDAI